ncbi:MAG: polysaccharide deacetylase family protein [Gaiellaceae bacterium]
MHASQVVKRAARPLLRVGGEPAAAVVEALLRRTGLKAGIAVAYHSLAATSGEPDVELVPPHGAELFETQLRHLARRYRVVPAAELPAAVAARRAGEPFPAAVTFDDDLPSHVEHALPALGRHGISATFFLTGSSLDAPFCFWWERLQRALDSGAPVPPPGGGTPLARRAAEIRPLGIAAEQLTPDERDRWSARLLESSGPDPEDSGLRVAGVRTLVEAGHTIGFHTRRHDPMPTLDDGRLGAAVRDGLDDLEQTAGRRPAVIGYPHGRADDRVAAAARSAGFELGYTTAETAVTPTSSPMLLGRLNPSYRSSGHFAVQLVRVLLAAQR